MLTLFLSVLLFIFSLILLVLDVKDHIQMSDELESIFSYGLCIGLTVFLISLGTYIFGCIDKGNRILEDQCRRNSCIYELRVAENIEEKEKAINDIFKWNSHVENMNKISNNPFLNFMANVDYVNSLEYIETTVLYMEVEDE